MRVNLCFADDLDCCVFEVDSFILFKKKQGGSIKMGPSLMRRYVHRLDRAIPTLYKNNDKIL